MSLIGSEISQRSIDVFRELVDTYMETGEPVGSRTISKRLKLSLSPATVRNIMADLEESGLLYAPHTSAGRLPTSEGLRFFVNSLLEVGSLQPQHKASIEKFCQSKNKDLNSALSELTVLLSGLSQCATLVVAPKHDFALKTVEFVHLRQGKTLVILVYVNDSIENRIIDTLNSVSANILAKASAYLNSKLCGHTLAQAKQKIYKEIQDHRAELDELTTSVVEAGLAVCPEDESKSGSLIVKGQSHLLNNVLEVNELEAVRRLFALLESKETIGELLDSSIKAEGIQIFIGSENHLFQLAGCSLVVSSYKGKNNQIVGALGVIGPSRMNYGKIIPLVDYTARMVTRMMGL